MVLSFFCLSFCLGKHAFWPGKLTSRMTEELEFETHVSTENLLLQKVNGLIVLAFHNCYKEENTNINITINLQFTKCHGNKDYQSMVLTLEIGDMKNYKDGQLQSYQ